MKYSWICVHLMSIDGQYGNVLKQSFTHEVRAFFENDEVNEIYCEVYFICHNSMQSSILTLRSART